MLENVKISEMTTMRLGGEAKYVAEVENAEDVAWAYQFATEHGLKAWPMGLGANTIGHDEGFDGIIILNKIQGIRLEGDLLIAGGGELWDDVVAKACAAGLSGIEAMTAIPGTAGAAPVQNIGAYGQEIAQVIESALVFDSFIEETREMSAAEMQFGYRRSIFNYGDMAGRYFIMEIRLRLHAGQLQPPFYTSLQKYVDENAVTDFSPANIRKMVGEIRAAKLPDPAVEASAGSFFKNVYLTDAEADDAEKVGLKVWRDAREHLPSAKVHKINAGWLIEQAGLAGQEFHGFKVSEKAALILINKSADSYKDLAGAREEIRDKVRRKFGYYLEQEPVELV